MGVGGQVVVLMLLYTVVFLPGCMFGIDMDGGIGKVSKMMQ